MVQLSDDHFSITVLAAPEAPTALVCLAGEIDLEASSALSDVADRLSAIAPTEVVVDVADVTFACSTLPNFLARMHLGLPNSSALVVCRPTTNVQRLLDLTDMARIATLRADLPTSGSWASLDGTRPCGVRPRLAPAAP
ncbi:STAS domain-containing protein [Micromonospora sp. LH3U1]|uniref:STAS domain-containing protein n=1 Tax=Micromonospora sp. LH3U1 TaxID=3018339 RepID=UPI00234BE547|nr:STAS domain-containing protein [Micromonospora sp. LH3U1]WCN79427.1 STAS domain-containing protein [Micromonospora sp. LH3U1]